MPSGLTSHAASPRPRPCAGTSSADPAHPLPRSPHALMELLSLPIHGHHRARRRKGHPFGPMHIPPGPRGVREARPALPLTVKLGSVWIHLSLETKTLQGPSGHRRANSPGLRLCPSRTSAPVGWLWVVGTEKQKVPGASLGRGRGSRPPPPAGPQTRYSSCREQGAVGTQRPGQASGSVHALYPSEQRGP